MSSIISIWGVDNKSCIEEGLKQKLNTNSDLISKYTLLSCKGKPTSQILTIIYKNIPDFFTFNIDI